MTAELANKVAVITGAGRGIGRAVAHAYAKAGMSVVCSARSTQEIDDVASAIKTAGGTCTAITCDVTRPEQVAELMRATEATYGGIDLVMVNAGMSLDDAPLTEADMSLWRKVINLNLIAAAEQCHAAIPYLRKRGGGKIIMTGSGVGRNAMAGRSAYACSKAGLAMLTRILARELRDNRIAVNEIIPGPVRTRLTGAPEEREIDDGIGSDILRVPGEWTKNPEDVTPLALFVATLPDDGPTGQVYSLTGRDLGRI